MCVLITKVCYDVSADIKFCALPVLICCVALINERSWIVLVDMAYSKVKLSVLTDKTLL